MELTALAYFTPWQLACLLQTSEGNQLFKSGELVA